MFKLLTGVCLCLAFGGAALAQTHAPAHHRGHHPRSEHEAPKPRNTQLPPDLTFEGNPTDDPSAFPGETDNQGYQSGVPENPR
jgi:hypothetical protein